jgi:hypothetical protein
MSRWFLALILSAAGTTGAGARDALGAINGCLQQLDPALDVGYERVAARCPDLAPSLAASSWAAWLPPDWNSAGSELSAGGLTELRFALTRLPERSGRAPRLEHLGAALAALVPGTPPHRSWWARLKEWLHEVLTPPPPNADRGWWRRVFGTAGLPKTLMEAIVWGALAVVVALAGAIVVNELRVAGLLRNWTLQSARTRAADAGARERTALRELEQAALSQQPGLLLEFIADRLAEQERLPPARALTVQELARAARLPPPQRERLLELGTACERVRFSDREVAPQALTALLARGRELLAVLEAATPEPQAAG